MDKYEEKSGVLRLVPDTAEEPYPSNLYKFKSNIQQRFNRQDQKEESSLLRKSLCSESGDELADHTSSYAGQEPPGGQDPRDHQAPDVLAHEHRVRDQDLHAGDQVDLQAARDREGVLQMHDQYNSRTVAGSSSLYVSKGFNFKLDEGQETKPMFPIFPPTLSEVKKTVPIFALNSKGSYYVPMSLDVSLIGEQPEEACPVLHPITISVNWQVG